MIKSVSQGPLPLISAVAIVTLLSICFGLSGCIPMIPVPSGQAPEPYRDDLLQFLRTPGVTRARVEERFGAAPISRMDGQLQIYAAARNAGMRLLLIAPPFIPATIPNEDYYFLFLEYDASGILQHHELVANKSDPNITVSFKCSTSGYCLAGEAWKSKGVYPFWWNSDTIKANRHTLVTDSLAETRVALQLIPPDSGCAFYFLPRVVSYGDIKGMGRVPKEVYYRLDDQRYGIVSELYDSSEKVFARWLLNPGAHVLYATDKNKVPVNKFEFACTDGER